MKRLLLPGERSGEVRIPASKSQAHRLLICAALSGEETRICCDGLSKDILATVACLRAMGAEIREEGSALRVRPIRDVPTVEVPLPCGESGSTLRFLLPVVGALGIRGRFLREGRLPERPLAPLDRELTDHGMELWAEGSALAVQGKLLPGAYRLPGNVSSQYISGLLLALPLLAGESSLLVEGAIESAAYIRMTENALRLSGISYRKEKNQYCIPGNQRPALRGELTVEGDWSNAAFFLCMGALSEKGLLVGGLNPDSPQGDRAVLELLSRFGARLQIEEKGILSRKGALRGIEIDAAPIPDLIPVLSVLAAGAEGDTRICNAGRLRLKESDRLQTTACLLQSLGGSVEELPEGLVIHGTGSLRGGSAESFGDHRIAMSAAVAACLSREQMEVDGAECVAKSYPRFWEDWDRLEGGTR